MFHSDNSDNPLESLFKRPSFHLSDQNPIPKQDDPSFFSNFPSPFFDEHDYLPLNQMLLYDDMLQPENHDFVADQNENKSDSNKKETAKRSTNAASKSKEKGRNRGVAPRKRTGKKDRHSKICTAQGIRDRRMRLSLQVARKFFDLQDMLGYDKASKTIEWLFCKSKKAIKELTKDNPQRDNLSISDAKSESFISECEVVSGIEENSNNEIRIEKKSRPKTNMRESREKARARARCRTREKMMIKNWSKSSPNHNDFQKLGSSNSPFEAVDQDNQEMVDFVNQLGDEGTIEKLLWSSCPNISDYNYNCSAAASCYVDPNSNFMGFLGNWDLLNNDRLNSNHFAVTDQVSFTGNYPNSVYSVTTPSFPLFHQ